MLRDDAMIVKLTVGQWTARKFDKAVTNKVADDYGCKPEVGRYRKMLLADGAVQAITKIVSAARGFHYQNTLSWDNDGGRILPVANFEKYRKAMADYKRQFEEAVRTFVDNYDAYRQEAEQRLRGMFNPSDYPSRARIGEYYHFSHDIEPVPSAEDFRVTLQDRDAQRIKKELEQRVKERETEAMRDLFLRLHEVVSKFADKVRDDKSIFRDSLVENVVELVELLPRLNVTNDSNLEKLRKEVASKLCAHEPDTLRKDAKARVKAATDADAILKKMAGYVGAKR